MTAYEPNQWTPKKIAEIWQSKGVTAFLRELSRTPSACLWYQSSPRDTALRHGIAQGTAWIPRCTRSAGCPGRCSRRCSHRSRSKVREKRVFAHRVLGTQKMMATKANRFVTTKETHSDVRVWPGKHSLFIAFSWLDVFLAVGECFRVGRGETCCFRNMPGALLQAVLQSRERKGHSWCRACGTSYLHERGCIGKRRNGRNR